MWDTFYLIKTLFPGGPSSGRGPGVIVIHGRICCCPDIRVLFVRPSPWPLGDIESANLAVGP
jgi:hypothetical protein